MRLDKNIISECISPYNGRKILDRETLLRTGILNWKNLLIKLFDWFHVRFLSFLAKSIRKRSPQIKNFTFSLWIIFVHTEAYRYQRKNCTNCSACKFCGRPLMWFGSEWGRTWTVFKTDSSWCNPVRWAPELSTWQRWSKALLSCRVLCMLSCKMENVQKVQGKKFPPQALQSAVWSALGGKWE